MADVYDYVLSTGVINVDAGEIKTQVEDEYKAKFGDDLSVDPRTPQGQLIAAETEARIAVADNNAALANQINPNLAGGVFLDATAALTGTFRSVQSKTTVLATITGVASTLIPANSQASESINGAVFQTVIEVTIPASGTLENVAFEAVDYGPIPCAAETLTNVVSNILGWETVTNPDAGSTGTLTQSDASFRNTRNAALAGQGMGSLEAINSALMMTPGVTSTNSGLENVENTTEVIEGVTMVPHSIYYCIAGTATDEDIATSFTRSKNGGSNYNNGNGIPVVYPYYSPTNGQTINIRWDEPSIQYISIQVTIQNLASVNNLTEAIQNAVVDYANGEVENFAGFTVGADVSPSEISAAIAKQIPGLFINKVLVGVNSFTKQGTTNNTSNAITGLTYNSDITIGMGILGDGIPASTTVSSLTGSTELVMNNNATASDTVILTFTKSVSLQSTPITIETWQQAATVAAYVTVIVI